jgi:excisionase family DNA binding protein
MFQIWYIYLVAADKLTLQEAASQLGVSRRRVEAMVERGQLPAERLGRQWVIAPAVLRSAITTRPASRGRPISPRTAWRLIAALPNDGSSGRSPALLDSARRKLRRRARHVDLYVHPALIGELLASDRLVLGGRRAAIGADVPVDETNELDIYVVESDASGLIDQVGAIESDDANVHLHIVPDEAWPFSPTDRVADPWVAWLDLADRQDRAADVLLDRLGVGRSRD